MDSPGLRNKLKAAFFVLLTAFLFVCGNLFFIAGTSFRQTPSRFFNLVIIVGALAAVIVITLWLMWRLLDPLVRRFQAENRFLVDESSTTKEQHESETGSLQDKILQVNSRLQQHLDELKNYGEHAQHIVAEANKSVVVLHSLLQINSLIKDDANLKEIYDFSLGKLVQFKHSSWAIIVLRDQYNTFRICADYGLSEKAHHALSEGGCARVFDLLLLNKAGWIIDEHSHDVDAGRVRSLFNTVNMIFVPLYRHAKIAGFIGLGSTQSEMPYLSNDIQLLEMFTRQLAVAIENDYLVHHRYRFEMRDTLTGLYNRSALINKLEDEIKKAMAFQKPCAFLLFSIRQGKEFAQTRGQLATETLVTKIANSVVENSGALGRIARYGDYDFALILPEINKKQAMKMAEEMKHKIGTIFSQENDAASLSICAAVAENPIDGIRARDLIEKAESALNKNEPTHTESAN